MTKHVLAFVALSLPLAALAATVRFYDVPDSVWYADYVYKAADDGIVSGYTDSQGRLTGEFGPGNSLTIAEALKMTMESSRFPADALRTDSVFQGHWAQRYADAAVEADFHLVLTRSSLDRPATRAEMAQMVTDAYDVHPKDLEDLNDYTDVSMNHEHALAIEAVTIDDIMVGDGRAEHCRSAQTCVRTTFRPDERLNRAEAVKIVLVARDAWSRYQSSASSHSSVSSTLSSSHSSSQMQSSSKSSQQTTDGNLVNYTLSGFTPSTITIKAGTTLEIRNQHTQAMWIASDPHPTHTSYPSMNALESVGTNGWYKFQFMTKGTYHYHNHLKPSDTGTIIVE